VKQYFSTAQVDFDLKVRNPARILRLPGTWNVKKKSAPDRPSRQCRVISTPDDWTPVHTDDLAAMVKRYGLDTEHKRQKQRKRQRAVSINGAGDYKTLDIVAWFTAHAHYKFEMGGGKHSVTCPWCSEHSSEDMPDGTDSVVWEAETGWPTFHCSHDHCEGRDLSDVMRVWGDADAFCDKQFVAGSFKCST